MIEYSAIVWMIFSQVMKWVMLTDVLVLDHVAGDMFDLESPEKAKKRLIVRSHRSHH